MTITRQTLWIVIALLGAIEALSLAVIVGVML